MKITEIKDLVYYDTETTGLDYQNDRILEHGLIRVQNNEIVDKLRLLVKQPVKISAESTAIHGITTEMIEAEGIEPKEAAKQVLDFMGDSIVNGLNNIGYDFVMLEVECNRLGLPRPKIENWIDTGLWHKGQMIGMAYNEKELFYKYAYRVKEVRAKGVKYNLDFLTKEYGCENLRDGGFHGAIKDLVMTHNIFNKMKEKYGIKAN